MTRKEILDIVTQNGMEIFVDKFLFNNRLVCTYGNSNTDAEPWSDDEKWFMRFKGLDVNLYNPIAARCKTKNTILEIKKRIEQETLDKISEDFV